MPATYRSTAFAANAAGTDVSSVAPSKPSGTVQGDGMIAIVAGFQSGSGVSAPAGWTAKQSNITSSTGLRVDIYTKIAGGSEPSSYTFSRLSGSGAMSAVIITIEDISADWESTLWTSAADNGTSTSATPNFTTALNPGELFFSGVCFWRNGSQSATGSAGWTEIQDFNRQDGAPGTNWRGQAVYRCNSVTAGGNSPASNTITLASTPSGQIEWAVSVASRVEGTGASTHSGATGSGTGTVTTNPTGSGALLHSGATAEGEGYEWPTADGAALHSGATADGVAYEYPIADGAVALSGATAAGVGYEWPTIDGACLHGGATASGELELSGTKLEIKVNGTWTDITTAIRHNTGVTIVRGKSGSGSQMQTTRCTFTLDNRDHRFSPFNPNGDYYGYLGRNTEVRMTKQETGVRFHGELSSYTFGTDRSGNDLIVDVECAGLLRRLEQGETPTKSPLHREVSLADPAPLAYWPCEEPEGAVRFSSPIAGVSPLRIKSGTSVLSSYEGFKCSEPIPQVGAAQWRSEQIPGAEVNGDGITVSFLLASPGGITNGTNLLRIESHANDAEAYLYGLWELSYSATDELTLTHLGTDTVTADVDLVGSDTGILVILSMRDTTAIGGSLEWALWTMKPGDSEPTFHGNDTAGGDIGHSTVIVVNPDLVALNESSSAYMGHIAVWSGATTQEANIDDLPSFGSLNAYRGEAAGVRFQRLCGEEGITFEGQGTMADSSPMGYQTSKAFTELLRECEETDLGVMYEIRDDLGLGYRVRSDLYNQTATATFDYEGNHLLEELKPIYDDKDIHNEVTVKREGGTEATFEVTTGPMSTSAVPTGIGRYEDSVTVSLETDAQCYPQAGWRAHLGTVDEVRVSSIKTGLEVPEIDMDGALTNALLALDVGDRVVVENTPAWMPVDDVDQIVDGYTERWDFTEHRFSFNTSPYSPYRVAQVTAAGTSTTQAKVGKAAGTCTLGAGIDADDTALSVTVASGSLWTTSGVDFDIIVGGEVMTVTAVSGASSPQAFTVTRSVNGIVKSHSSGAEVKLYRPAIIAL